MRMIILVIVRMSVPMMMIMTVIMVVIMIMAVIMIMIMSVMMVIMVMMMRVARLRACTIRLERRRERRQLRGGAGEQRLDLGVAEQTQSIGEDLHRHMTIAELPRDAGERGRIGDARLDQRF